MNRLLIVALLSAFFSGAVYSQKNATEAVPLNLIAPTQVNHMVGERKMIAGRKGEFATLEIRGRYGAPVLVDLSSIPMTAIFSFSDTPNGNVIVIGSANNDIDVVAIVDPKTGRLVDWFLAHRPSVSLDGRYIAFARAFVSHWVDSVNVCYAVYDSTKDSEFNRPLAIEYKSPDFLNYRDVGYKIYPTTGGLTQNACLSANDESTHTLISNIIWTENSSSFFFVDKDSMRVNIVGAKYDYSSRVSVRTYDLNAAIKECNPNCLGVKVTELKWRRPNILDLTVDSGEPKFGVKKLSIDFESLAK